MIILVLIEMVFIIICERFHGTIYLNSMLLVILDFVSVFKLELMYIPLYPKYQAEPHSSPWFSVAACAAAIAHRNPFFYLYQQNKSSESKVKLRQALIIAAGFLKLSNLHLLIKQKIVSLPRNLACRTFHKLLIVFSTKAYLL